MNSPLRMSLLSGVMAVGAAGAAQANCPAVTMADMMGVAPGAFPQQYELAEFEAAAGCKMEFSGNPESDALKSLS